MRFLVAVLFLMAAAFAVIANGKPGFGGRSLFKYYYKPHNFEDTVHPQWWKRGGVDAVEGDQDEGEIKTSPELCNLWNVGGRMCIPWICTTLDPAGDNGIIIPKADCLCVFPHPAFCRKIQ